MDEFKRALDLYWDTFQDSFPTFPMRCRGEKKIIEIIKECVEKKKDVYELGYLTLDLDVRY